MTDAPPKTITDIVSDFLGSAPDLTALAEYRLPPYIQERAQELLRRQHSGTLSPMDQAEIEEFRQVDHLLTLVKAKARLKLQSRG